MKRSPLFRARIGWCLTIAAGVAWPLGAQVVNDGATATLSNVTNSFTGTVTVGTNGAFTLLVLSDNALLTNSAHGVVGFNVTARSNEVHLVSPSARWRMGGNLFVGSNAAMNRLVVSNGAFLENNNGILGNRVDSSNNLALVTGVGSVWSNRNDITVGTLGRYNQVLVSNGGWVASQNTRLGGNAVGSNNLVLVTGSGSVWSNTLGVFMGSSAPGKMVIEAGGLVHGDSGTIGGFGSASNSEAVVTGPGSRWNNASFLTIGNNVGRNRLVVSNGATVWSGSALMGSASAASSNQAVITGAGSVWSNHMFSNNLVVASNASLIGNGTIDGILTVSSGGRLIPGAPIGRISSTDTVILQGAANLQIDKSGGSITNDPVAVAGAILYGGTLTVTDIGADVLAAGDRFPLFSAAPFVGSFATITLPPLGPGLSWANNLSADGSIEVIVAGQPGFASISLSGTNVIIAGTNGTPGASYTVLTATNVALPSSNWVSPHHRPVWRRRQVFFHERYPARRTAALLPHSHTLMGCQSTIMRTRLLLLAAFLLGTSLTPLRAQVVADGATVTLSNVTNTIAGTVRSGATVWSGAGLLGVNSPLLARDPLTGLFTLTIGVEKATDLTNFFPFPMTAPQTTINAEGKLEFQFGPPDNAAFFRLEAR
jgi:T5SS/PEP-CTERM-associated repeat protein